MSNVIDLFPAKQITESNAYKDATMAMHDIICLDGLDEKLSKAKNAHDYCMIASQIAKDIQSILQYHNVKA
jgi:hypothetical protein